MTLDDRLRGSAASFQSFEVELLPFRTVRRRHLRRRAAILGLTAIAAIAVVALVVTSSTHRATVSVITPSSLPGSTAPPACDLLSNDDVARILHTTTGGVDTSLAHLPRSTCFFQTTSLPLSTLALSVHTSTSAQLAAMFHTLRFGKERVVVVSPATTPPLVRPVEIPGVGDEALWQPNIGLLVRSGPYEIEVSVKHWNTEDRESEIPAVRLVTQRLESKHQ